MLKFPSHVVVEVPSNIGKAHSEVTAQIQQLIGPQEPLQCLAVCDGLEISVQPSNLGILGRGIDLVALGPGFKDEDPVVLQQLGKPQGIWFKETITLISIRMVGKNEHNIFGWQLRCPRPYGALI